MRLVEKKIDTNSVKLLLDCIGNWGNRKFNHSERL